MSPLRHHLALGFTVLQKAPGLLDRVQTTACGWERRREGEELREEGALPTHSSARTSSRKMEAEFWTCTPVQDWSGMGGAQRVPP